MEELVLTTPEVKPEEVKNKYKVITLQMDHEAVVVTAPPPAPTEPGVFVVVVKDNLGGTIRKQYTGKAATDYIKFINTANFSTKSLHKRILEKLVAEGVIPGGTVAGTPDPPPA